MDIPPIAYGALEGSLEKVISRHKAGLDIDYNDPKHGTALMQAVHRNHLQIAKYLLENGAKTELFGPEGRPAVNYCRSIRMQRLLEQFGLEVPLHDYNVCNSYQALKEGEAKAYDNLIYQHGLIATLDWEYGGLCNQVEEFQDALTIRGLIKKAGIIAEIIHSMDASGDWRGIPEEWIVKNNSWLEDLGRKYCAVKDEIVD